MTNPALSHCACFLILTVLLSAFGSCDAGPNNEQAFEGGISIWISGVDTDSWMLPHSVDGYRVDVSDDTYEVGGIDSGWIDPGGDEGDSYTASFYLRIDGYDGAGTYPARVEAFKSETLGYDWQESTVLGSPEHCAATIGEDELFGGVECDLIVVEAVGQYDGQMVESEPETGSLRASWAGEWVAAESADRDRTGGEAPQ